MPDIAQMTESKFLKRADVGAGKLMTIESCDQQNVARKDDAPEMKWCVTFSESEKPMVLNRINGELIAMITGERNSDNWSGHKVVLYDDPAISYGGKLVGGIRVRAAKGQANKPKATSSIEDEADDTSSVPF